MAGRRTAKARDRHTREVQERARLHAARRAWHDGLIHRRHRDNIVASVVGGLLVAGSFASQAAFAQATDPAPAPSPSSSISAPPVAPFETPNTPAPQVTP